MMTAPTTMAAAGGPQARRGSRSFRFLALVVVVLAGGAVFAQEFPEPEGSPLPPGSMVFALPAGYDAVDVLPATDNGLPNIMVTGYWPPTNDMLRPFSPNPAQNPGGWVGENWENRGYNVYAFFPEFPTGLGKGEGDFEVDYQDTSGDFWSISEIIKPVAIVTTGRTYHNFDWRLEGGAQNWGASGWSADYLEPYRPTPELPISTEPVPNQRMSTLPIQDIIDAVLLSGSNADPFTTVIDDNRFLCGFNGYHANWYRALHSAPGDPNPCLAAGHIHVGYAMTLADAEIAAEATIRALIAYLDSAWVMFGDGFESGDTGAWTATVP